MFSKVSKTEYPPENNPVLIWDGECGFCKYWVIKLKRLTGDNIIYIPYQNCASEFKDLDVSLFKEASHLIETDGKIYSGPNSLYQSLLYTPHNQLRLHNYYQNYSLFRFLSNHIYSFIANHRGFMFKLTQILFGKNP